MKTAINSQLVHAGVSSSVAVMLSAAKHPAGYVRCFAALSMTILSVYLGSPVLVRVIVLVIFAVGAVSCAAPVQLPAPEERATEQTAQPALTELPVCASPSAANVVLHYAIDHKIFQEYGLAVSLTDIGSGSDAVTAMIAGEFELCQVAGAAVVNAAAAGEDIVMIGGLIDQQIYSLVVRPEIGSAADLVGKAVAISQAGGASDTAMRSALSVLGLKPNQDVALLSIGKQTDRMAAMESGAVVGTLVSVPENVRARELGYHELLGPSAMNTPYQHTVIAVRRAYMVDHRETLVSFLKAVTQTIAQMKQDRDGTITTFAKMQGVDPATDPAYVAEVYDVLVQEILKDAPYPSPDGVQALIELAAQENPAAAALTPDQVIDASILQVLADSGFFDE